MEVTALSLIFSTFQRSQTLTLQLLEGDGTADVFSSRTYLSFDAISNEYCAFHFSLLTACTYQTQRIFTRPKEDGQTKGQMVSNHGLPSFIEQVLINLVSASSGQRKNGKHNTCCCLHRKRNYNVSQNEKKIKGSVIVFTLF